MALFVRTAVQLQVDIHRAGQHSQDHRRQMEAASAEEIRDEAGGDGAEGIGERADGRAVQHDLRQTAEDQLAGERHEEGRDIKIGNPHALPTADQNADQQRDQQRDQNAAVVVDLQDGGDGADEGQHGTDRQVDVAGQDDGKHAKDQQDDVGVLQNDIGQVHGREDQAVRKQMEQNCDHDENNDHAVGAKRLHNLFFFHCSISNPK